MHELTPHLGGERQSHAEPSSREGMTEQRHRLVEVRACIIAVARGQQRLANQPLAASPSARTHRATRALVELGGIAEEGGGLVVGRAEQGLLARPLEPLDRLERLARLAVVVRQLARARREVGTRRRLERRRHRAMQPALALLRNRLVGGLAQLVMHEAPRARRLGLEHLPRLQLLQQLEGPLLAHARGRVEHRRGEARPSTAATSTTMRASTDRPSSRRATSSRSERGTAGRRRGNRRPRPSRPRASGRPSR